MNGYVLDFVIPQGPTGPTGATGEVGATGLTGSLVSAYGGRYSTTSSSLTLGIASQTQIPLSLTMPNLNTTYTNNSITISQTGVYEINYYINLSATLATTVTTAVRNNGTNIASTVISRAISSGVSSIYSGSIITNLSTGSVIDMAVSALVSVGLSLPSGTNATLSVKRIS